MLDIVNPNNQSRRNCDSTRREIAGIHMSRDTQGAPSSLRRFAGAPPMSGRPIQYLKQKANAKPEYRGAN